jgi:hypoxanthine phosphoribosyltransferase
MANCVGDGECRAVPGLPPGARTGCPTRGRDGRDTPDLPPWPIADGDGHIGGVVVTRAQIARRIGVLAGHIAERYARRELTILAVLTGSLIFLSDLIRRMPLRMRLNLISVSSYPGRATASRGPRFVLPEMDLAGKDVLVLDDILDSGQTLACLVEAVKSRNPASVRTCVLVRKDRPDLAGRIEPDFWGFAVNNEFLVGYGLDFDNLYRNLPDICTLRHEGGEASEGKP